MPDIPDIDKVDPTHGDSDSSIKPDANAFKDQMQNKEPNPLQKQNVPSPMEIANAQKVAAGSPPDMKKIQGQMTSVSGQLGDLKQKLHTKGLKLKNSDKYLVRQKLGRANEHIKKAAKHVGVDNEEEKDGSFDKKLNRSKNPIARFLSMVSDGQHQMVQAAQQVNKLNSSGKSVNAGQLLLVQIKLNKAQQELNYTSVILGNATSMLKTLMNTQI